MAAPAARALSFASAISRFIGAMPQLVQAISRFFGTYLRARPMVAATSAGVSTRSEATSMTPTMTSLPFRSAISSMGTLEWMHSSETCLMLLLASTGKISAYCRHSVPSVSFQSVLALMP